MTEEIKKELDARTADISTTVAASTTNLIDDSAGDGKEEASAAEIAMRDQLAALSTS